MLKIMFVCLGNICRSPLAHALMEQKVDDQGLSDKILVDSSGTGDWHIGNRSDSRMILEAKKHGVEMTHRAQQFHPLDKEQNYIFAMDSSNFSNIQAILKAPHKGLKMFRCYENSKKSDIENNAESGVSADTPDPYFGGQQGFSEVYKIIDRNCDLILVNLKKDHSL